LRPGPGSVPIASTREAARCHLLDLLGLRSEMNREANGQALVYVYCRDSEGEALQTKVLPRDVALASDVFGQIDAAGPDQNLFAARFNVAVFASSVPVPPRFRPLLLAVQIHGAPSLCGTFGPAVTNFRK
jgi:hypothetical protein